MSIYSLRRCLRVFYGDQSASYCYCRFISVAVSLQNKQRTKPEELKITSQPPSKVDHDIIGPASPDSNIRPTIYYIPPCDTPLEQEFRKRRQEVYRWNHAFWAEHNKKFAQAKKQFTVAKLDQLGEHLEDGTKRTLTAEQMSEFYKRFLEENFNMMENYHREWYRRNNSLTWMYLRVYLQRLWLGVKRKVTRR